MTTVSQLQQRSFIDIVLKVEVEIFYATALKKLREMRIHWRFPRHCPVALFREDKLRATFGVGSPIGIHSRQAGEKPSFVLIGIGIPQI